MNQLLKIDRTNSNGRVFFTTDIHGSFDLVFDAMKEVSFDTSRDIIICGGDMCDRGDYSHWVIDFIDEPWFYSVRGNHEELLIKSYIDLIDTDRKEYTLPIRIFYQNGGEWFLDLVESSEESDRELALKIFKKFNELPLAIELQIGKTKYGIIHAECPNNDWNSLYSDLSDYDIDVSMWSRTRYDRVETSLVNNVDWLLVGHTPTQTGDVELLGNVMYADLGSFFRGKIAFFELTEGFSL